jgi:hypothetical protein
MQEILYQQPAFPVLQNRVYDTREEAMNCLTGNLEIVQDTESGLIFNAAFQSELMQYDANYNNEQANSPAFRKHLEEVANKIESLLGKKSLVEVGCGKGVFLEMLLTRGADVVGFDPAYDGDNPRIAKKLFEPGLVQSAKGLILRHVLEHVQNPVDFLFQLKESNGGKGLIYIEVPCFDWICLKRAWFDIFYEHVNYFRLQDFYRMFSQVIDSGYFFGNQYLYVIADLASLRKPTAAPGDRVRVPVDFLDFLNRTEQSRTEQPVCVWGAASKGVIFSLLQQRMGMKIDVVIDINPQKQGKYLPLTGLQVQSPETGLKGLNTNTPIYIMNSNYSEEIKVMSNNKFRYIEIDL